MPGKPKALFFDVFGTVVDWRTSIARESEAVLKPKGHALDWLAFADAWRDEYQPAMEEVRTGDPVLQARRAAPAQPRAHPAALRSGRLDEPTLHALNRAWHRLDGWPDVARRPPRLHKKIPDRAGLERQHLADGRHRAAQRFSLGRDPRRRDRGRLQAEAARLSRAPAKRSICTPEGMHDGRGAFRRSRRRGEMRAARPRMSRARTSTVPARARPKPTVPVDVAVEDLASSRVGFRRKIFRDEP